MANSVQKPHQERYEMTIISAAQLHAIREKVSREVDNQQTFDERRALHARSKELVSTWPDVLQARRQRKHEERQAKLGKDEAMRAELDRQDAAEREEARQKKLQDAAQKLWAQTDGMKTLHKSRLLAEVVRQRQEQLAQHAQRAAAVRAAEAAFLDCQRQQVQEALEAEVKQAQASRQKTAEVSRAREEQLDAFKARLLAEREGARRRGQEIREQALREAKQDAQKEEEGKERARAAVRETEQANEEVLRLKQQQREQERQADAQIAEYVAKQAEKEEQRAASLAAKAAAKEARRRQISQILERNFVEKRKGAEAHQFRAAEEARIKADNSAAEGAQRRAERVAEIERSRREQMAQRQAQEQQRLREEAAFSAHITSVREAVRAEQELKAALQRERNLAHAAFLQHQIEIKQRKQSLETCCTNRAGSLNSAVAIPLQQQP